MAAKPIYSHHSKNSRNSVIKWRSSRKDFTYKVSQPGTEMFNRVEFWGIVCIYKVKREFEKSEEKHGDVKGYNEKGATEAPT